MYVLLLFKSNQFSAFKDRFTLEEPTKEEMELQKRYEFYRILIIPTPRYTKAAQNLLEKKELTANKTGELIEGSGKLKFLHFWLSITLGQSSKIPIAKIYYNSF